MTRKDAADERAAQRIRQKREAAINMIYVAQVFLVPHADALIEIAQDTTQDRRIREAAAHGAELAARQPNPMGDEKYV